MRQCLTQSKNVTFLCFSRGFSPAAASAPFSVRFSAVTVEHLHTCPCPHQRTHTHAHTWSIDRWLQMKWPGREAPPPPLIGQWSWNDSITSRSLASVCYIEWLMKQRYLSDICISWGLCQKSFLGEGCVYYNKQSVRVHHLKSKTNWGGKKLKHQNKEAISRQLLFVLKSELLIEPGVNRFFFNYSQFPGLCSLIIFLF